MPPLTVSFTAHEQAVLDAAIAFSNDKSDVTALLFKDAFATVDVHKAHEAPVLHEEAAVLQTSPAHPLTTQHTDGIAAESTQTAPCDSTSVTSDAIPQAPAVENTTQRGVPELPASSEVLDPMRETPVLQEEKEAPALHTADIATETPSEPPGVATHATEGTDAPMTTSGSTTEDPDSPNAVGSTPVPFTAHTGSAVVTTVDSNDRDNVIEDATEDSESPEDAVGAAPPAAARHNDDAAVEIPSEPPGVTTRTTESTDTPMTTTAFATEDPDSPNAVGSTPVPFTAHTGSAVVTTVDNNDRDNVIEDATEDLESPEDVVAAAPPATALHNDDTAVEIPSDPPGIATTTPDCTTTPVLVQTTPVPSTLQAGPALVTTNNNDDDDEPENVTDTGHTEHSVLETVVPLANAAAAQTTCEQEVAALATGAPSALPGPRLTGTQWTGQPVTESRGALAAYAHGLAQLAEDAKDPAKGGAMFAPPGAVIPEPSASASASQDEVLAQAPWNLRPKRSLALRTGDPVAVQSLDDAKVDEILKKACMAERFGGSIPIHPALQETFDALRKAPQKASAPSNVNASRTDTALSKDGKRRPAFKLKNKLSDGAPSFATRLDQIPQAPPRGQVQAALQSTRTAGPEERRNVLLSMVSRILLPDHILLVCKFAESNLLTLPSKEWSATLCTSEMVDQFFIPLVHASTTSPMIQRSTQAYGAVAKLAAAVFSHEPTVSVFATLKVRDKFLLPLIRLVSPRDFAVVALAVDGLCACEEGRQLLVCKPVRDFLLALVQFVDVESFPTAAGALANLTTGQEKAATARKLFATPTFRDGFFLPLVRLSDQESMFELVTAFSNISAMDGRVFATTSICDGFFIPLGRVAAACALRDREAARGDDCCIAALVCALRGLIEDRRLGIVFAESKMWSSFFVPLIRAVRSAGVLSSLLLSVQMLMNAPTSSCTRGRGVEEVMTAVAERGTSPDVVLMIASVLGEDRGAVWSNFSRSTYHVESSGIGGGAA